MKTNFILSKSLFEQIQMIARDLKVSRSRLVAMALEEFVHRYQKKQSINQAQENDLVVQEEAAEQIQRRHMRRVQFELLKGDQW